MVPKPALFVNATLFEPRKTPHVIVTSKRLNYIFVIKQTNVLSKKSLGRVNGLFFAFNIALFFLYLNINSIILDLRLLFSHVDMWSLITSITQNRVS